MLAFFLPAACWWPGCCRSAFPGWWPAAARLLNSPLAALGLSLVVVYLRSADSAVVAALSALLLACCYLLACGLLLVAVRWWPAVKRWPWHWWPAGAGVVAVAVHAWPLVVACCWCALPWWWPVAWLVAGCGL